MKVGTQVGAHISNKRKSAYKLRPAAVALWHEFHAGASAGGPAEIARTGLEATEDAAPRYQDDGRSRFEPRADQACHTQVVCQIAAGSAEVQHRHGLPEYIWQQPLQRLRVVIHQALNEAVAEYNYRSRIELIVKGRRIAEVVDMTLPNVLQSPPR